MRRPLALLTIGVGATIALWRLRSRVPLPQLHLRWVIDVGPDEAAISLLRVVALVGAIYLVVIATLHVVVPTWSPARRFVTRLTLPSLRALLVTTVLTTSSAGAAFASARTTVPPPISIALVESPAPPEPPAQTSLPPANYSVKSGDCFWSIAKVVMTAHLGRPATNAEVATYWRRLIDANRRGLAHPDNPDLIFPGQVIVLPEP